MTPSLRQILLKKSYCRIPLSFTRTNHLEIHASLNNIPGTFILDTGASNSCIGFEASEKFKVFAEDSNVKAAGAGAIDMLTKLSEKNKIMIGSWHKKNISVILFDLSHVNTALTAHNAKPVDGIIGADILKKGKAVIDYERKCLYLR